MAQFHCQLEKVIETVAPFLRSKRVEQDNIQAELHKHLKNIKKNKATGPDDVKGVLYIALGRNK